MTSSPTGSSPPAAPAGATIQGTLVTGSSVAAASAVHAMSAPAGIRISITGTNLITTTDASGKFVITGVPSGTVELHLEGAGLDARLTLTGLTAGQTLTITVRASGSSASLDSDDNNNDQDHEAELKGAIQSIDLATSSLMVAGKKVVTNASTKITGEQDTTLALKDLKVGEMVDVSGTTQADQSVLARSIKVEGGEGDHESEVELEGAIQSINLGAGSLMVAGRNVLTDSQTRIGGHDKKLTLSDLKVGQKVQVEGIAQASGVLARKIELEGNDD